MEDLLHYCWKYRLYQQDNLKTSDGQTVEVISTGTHNTDAGPDFFNAKIRIGDTTWAGNIEIHQKSSHWFLHKHDADAAFDNVILHVVEQHDKPVIIELLMESSVHN